MAYLCWQGALLGEQRMARDYLVPDWSQHRRGLETLLD